MKLRKHHSLVDDAWFCDLITVRGPGACEEAAFPCYRWVQGQGVLSLPEGTGEGGAGRGRGGSHRETAGWEKWVLGRGGGDKTGIRAMFHSRQVTPRIKGCQGAWKGRSGSGDALFQEGRGLGSMR